MKEEYTPKLDSPKYEPRANVPEYGVDFDKVSYERNSGYKNQYVVHDSTPSESMKVEVPDYQLKKTYEVPVKSRTSPSPKKKKKSRKKSW